MKMEFGDVLTRGGARSIEAERDGVVEDFTLTIVKAHEGGAAGLRNGAGETSKGGMGVDTADADDGNGRGRLAARRA